MKNNEVVCQLCSKKVVAKGSNASNLIARFHVENRTKKVSEKGGGKGNDSKPTTIVSNIKKLKKYDRSSK